jgi:hypothetical protein
MQLVQLFILRVFISFIMSSSHLFVGLPSGRVNIGFHLYALFIILSSGSLIFVLLCDLIYPYVLLIHRLF